MGKGRDRGPAEKEEEKRGEMGRGRKYREGQGRDGAKEERREKREGKGGRENGRRKWR